VCLRKYIIICNRNAHGDWGGAVSFRFNREHTTLKQWRHFGNLLAALPVDGGFDQVAVRTCPEQTQAESIKSALASMGDDTGAWLDI